MKDVGASAPPLGGDRDAGEAPGCRDEGEAVGMRSRRVIMTQREIPDKGVVASDQNSTEAPA
jgi:hypothetical protein